MTLTQNIALILPVFVPGSEFIELPPEEIQIIYWEIESALYCHHSGE